MRKKSLIIIIVCATAILLPLQGQTWEPIKRLTWNSGGSHHPAVATDSSDFIHVVWYDETPGNDEIYYKKSTDGGATWSSKRLTWNLGTSVNPDIAIDGNGGIHVVWQDFSPGNSEIYYQKSTNGGVSWSSKRLTWNPDYSHLPKLAVDKSNHIHMVWFNWVEDDFEIYYKKSTNGGTTWSSKRLTWNALNSRFPAITTDISDNIHVVWQDKSPGNEEIYYKRSTDGGATWSTKRLTWNSSSSEFADICVDSFGGIHVVWQDYAPGNCEVFYRKSTDGGVSWTAKRLTWNSGYSYQPIIHIDSDDSIHIVWYDTIFVFREIFIKKSIDYGASWLTKRLTDTDGDSQNPAIASDSNSNIHIVWSDDPQLNWEIYYIKGIQ